MILKMTMSVLGLYTADNSIFDELTVPTGIDRNTLIQQILLETANREVLYPNPDVLKQAIGLWAYRSYHTWDRLLFTTTVTYDPIANYDRTETWTDTDTVSSTRTETGESSTQQTQSGTSSGSDTGNSSGGNTRQILAFNDSSLQDSEKVTSSDVSSHVTSGETLDSLTGSATDSRTISDTTTHTINKSGRAYGNIGVTTTQQMLESERALVQFNIYDYIVKSFCDKFVLGVW